MKSRTSTYIHIASISSLHTHSFEAQALILVVLFLLSIFELIDYPNGATFHLNLFRQALGSNLCYWLRG